jgi:uncharacterized protein
MTVDEFGKIKAAVLLKLQGLDPSLTYHSMDHTLDVLEQCIRIAGAEGITDDHEIFLLKVAALYHDTGFLFVYRQHEAEGCKIFLQDAHLFGLTEEDKQKITRLIMVTQLPQTPLTIMEKVICDADLDYLGRDDFFEIADNLRREFLWYNIVADNTAWENLQYKFLMQHAYHTESSRLLREPIKQQHIARIRHDEVAK